MSLVWWKLSLPAEDDELSVPHYYPVRDFVEHEAAESCVCGPVAVVDEADGGVVAFRHHPLDESQEIA